MKTLVQIQKWHLHIVSILIVFFQISVISYVYASPTNLGFDPHNPISKPYTYGEIESFDWSESGNIEAAQKIDSKISQQVADIESYADAISIIPGAGLAEGFSKVENGDIGGGLLSLGLGILDVGAGGTASATKTGVKVAVKGSKSIVIGEGMGAVKAAAKTLQSQGVNAKWYQAWSKNFPINRLMTPAELGAAKARNARWLNTKINQGYEIYDIGIDAVRPTRSPLYQLERSILQQRGYPTTVLPR